ncbi:hypothetical protein N7526_003674 [Penicillium atrosanguineum]|nr:hypothetical protein N7526_003674 [Penicillium atrosanguineum]
MFVYSNTNLPPDPEYPPELERLGFFITEKDMIRRINDPDLEYKYKINRNDRFNIRNRAAMNEAIRNIVLPRLADAGLETLRLPFRDGHPPRDSFPSETHVPVLVSPNLLNAPRIILVFGEPIQDIGIWSYRAILQDGINIGSAVNFTKAVLGESKGEECSGERTDTALILANTGQLLWHCGTTRAITTQTWLANSRPSGASDQAGMSHRNVIPWNRDWQEHINYVFQALWRYLGPSSRVDVIGMSEGGLGAINYLMDHWERWRPYISAMCLADPLQSTNVEIDVGTLVDPTSFTAFMSSRCRAYIVSQDEADTPQMGYRHHGCNCYSSGETENSEGIMLSAWPHMLAWLDILYNDRTYAEEVVVMGADMDDNMQQAMERLAYKTGNGFEMDSIAEPETVNQGTQDDDLKDGGVKLQAKITDMKQKTITEDVKQETMEWVDAMGNHTQDRVVKAEEPSIKTATSPAPEKTIMQAIKAAIYESDDGYFGDVEEMARSYMQRSASVSETETDSF